MATKTQPEENLKEKLEQAEKYIQMLKNTIDTQDKRIHNLELLYTRKSLSVMEAVRSFYRHVSLELEEDND